MVAIAERGAKVALTSVLCNGRRKNGSPCLHILFKAHPGDFNIYWELKCPKCGKLAAFGPNV